jgi:hypothetical protein
MSVFKVFINVYEENIYQRGECTTFNNLIVHFQITGSSCYLIVSYIHNFIVEYGMELCLCIASGKE